MCSRKKTLVFVGTIKKTANCGESMKNHLFISRFKTIFDRVIVIDIFQPRKHPMCFIKVIITALMHHNDTIALSVSPATADKFIRLLLRLGCKKIYYWSVGILLVDYFKEGKFKAITYNKLKAVYVQSPKMVEELNKFGVKNVIYVSNSKYINYLPEIKKEKGDKTRFVFLSRIHPEKGCKEIIEAARQLNAEGMERNYIVDFYGAIAPNYECEFRNQLIDKSNLSYKGFLDLTSSSGYDLLSSYEVMLFPTYYDGEAFPGVVIDAFVAALPIIATDWHFNTEIINSDVGVIIPPRDVKSLKKAMEDFITGKIAIHQLRMNSQSRAMRYDNRNVLSKENLTKIGFLS